MKVEEFGEKLLNIVVDLIENKNVKQFYSGYRGAFDVYCSNLVHDLKIRYPDIKSTMVLSYYPEVPASSDYAFELPEYFDDSVYLLERKVPKPYAIIETNKCLVDKVDFIVAGVMMHGGGAYKALEYAHRRKKPIISIIDGWEV